MAQQLHTNSNKEEVDELYRSAIGDITPLEASLYEDAKERFEEPEVESFQFQNDNHKTESAVVSETCSVLNKSITASIYEDEYVMINEDLSIQGQPESQTSNNSSEDEAIKEAERLNLYDGDGPNTLTVTDSDSSDSSSDDIDIKKLKKVDIYGPPSDNSEIPMDFSMIEIDEANEIKGNQVASTDTPTPVTKTSLQLLEDAAVDSDSVYDDCDDESGSDECL